MPQVQDYEGSAVSFIVTDLSTNALEMIVATDQTKVSFIGDLTHIGIHLIEVILKDDYEALSSAKYFKI